MSEKPKIYAEDLADSVQLPSGYGMPERILAGVFDNERIEYIRADVAQSQPDAANRRIAELEALVDNATAFFRTPHGEWLYGDESTPLVERIKAMAFEMDARIAELEAAQTWVSVDKRLPDDEDNGVIAWTNNASDYSSFNFDLAFYHKQFGWLMATEWEHGDPTVTHWMPLPPPPATGSKAMEKRDE